jgi:type IV pilus assembly protein PilC
MPIFRYQALNSANQRVAGHVAADIVAQAVAQLEAQGLIVQSIAVAPDGELLEVGPAILVEPRTASPPSPYPPDQLAERALLEQHLAGVLEQSRPLVPALRAYAAEMPDGRRKRELQEVCHILSTGNAAEAAQDFSQLPEYWIPLLSAASPSRDAGRILSEFLEESRQADQMAREWRRSIIYPVIVILIAIGLMIAFSFTIAPQFKDLFNNFDLELNSFTAFNIALAEWITSGGALIAVVFLAAIIGGVYALRRQLPLPVTAWFGDCFGLLMGRSASRVQFTRFSADLLDAGIDVPQAVRIASSASRRASIRRAGWQLAHALETHAPGIPYRDARALSVSAIHALRTPIPTPARVQILKELSQCHAERARRRFTWTRGFFEPLALAFVALFVGNVMLSMFVPLIDLINNLTG